MTAWQGVSRAECQRAAEAATAAYAAAFEPAGGLADEGALYDLHQTALGAALGAFKAQALGEPELVAEVESALRRQLEGRYADARRRLAASGEALAAKMLAAETAKLRALMAAPGASVEAVEGELRRCEQSERACAGVARAPLSLACAPPCAACLHDAAATTSFDTRRPTHSHASHARTQAHTQCSRSSGCHISCLFASTTVTTRIHTHSHTHRAPRFLDEYDLKVPNGPFKYKKAAEFLMNTTIIGIKGIVKDILAAKEAAAQRAAAAEADAAAVRRAAGRRCGAALHCCCCYRRPVLVSYQAGCRHRNMLALPACRLQSACLAMCLVPCAVAQGGRAPG